MKAVVAAFNQEKALVGAFPVITNLRMELFEALVPVCPSEQIASFPERTICEEWPLSKLPPVTFYFQLLLRHYDLRDGEGREGK